jgi:hypothetical protein
VAASFELGGERDDGEFKDGPFLQQGPQRGFQQVAMEKDPQSRFQGPEEEEENRHVVDRPRSAVP